MDGVIVNSEPLHERAFLDVLAEIGYAENHGIDFPAYYGQSEEEPALEPELVPQR